MQTATIDGPFLRRFRFGGSAGAGASFGDLLQGRLCAAPLHRARSSVAAGGCFNAPTAAKHAQREATVRTHVCREAARARAA